MEKLWSLIVVLTLGLLSASASASDAYSIQKAQVSNDDYHLTVFLDKNEFEFNRIHSWRLQVKTSDGEPADNLAITVPNGGMEAHGHGLPTIPVVEPGQMPGNYWVRGMKFQMPGDWFVEFEISQQGKETQIIKYDFFVYHQ